MSDTKTTKDADQGSPADQPAGETFVERIVITPEMARRSADEEERCQDTWRDVGAGVGTLSQRIAEWK